METMTFTEQKTLALISFNACDTKEMAVKLIAKKTGWSKCMSEWQYDLIAQGKMRYAQEILRELKEQA